MHYMIRNFLPIPFLLLFAQCQSQHVRIEGNDPDIVLVNIEKGNRTFIAKILSKIDSLKPVVVGIDVRFESAKDTKQDSTLANALRKLNNEYLIYYIDDNDIQTHSIPLFTEAVEDEGLLEFERTFGLISNMRPLININDTIHESFALKIAKGWKPDLKASFRVNESLPIEYSRTLDRYLRINGSDLIELPTSEFDIPNKIILVGYIGPSNEDMYKTPLRFLEDRKLKNSQPDTYGLVIIANQIRTILNHK
jgi:CHASE2 domain-containing sensor protein